MGCGIVTVTKEWQGESWTNSYGVVVGNEAFTPLAVADIADTGILGAWSTETTLPGSPTYAGGVSCVHAIVGFERLLHWKDVSITKVFLWDGIKNDTSGSVFQAVTVNLPCLWDGGGSIASAVVAPANVSYQVNKVPAGPSIRNGRNFYRAALLDTDVAFGGHSGVKWADATVQTGAVAKVVAYQTESELVNWEYPGEGYLTCTIGIPKYASADDPAPGDLVAVFGITALVGVSPTSRQVRRGRKRPTTAPTP